MSQIMEMLIIFTVGFILQIPILLFINFLRKNRLLKNIRIVAVIAYFGVVANLTLWPLVLNQPPVNLSQISFNLIPFESIVGALNHSYYMVGIRNVLGNFVLLFPLAFLLKINGARQAILYGLLISLGIEIVQVILTMTGWIHRRSLDIDDIILNSAGFYFGYGIRVIQMKIYRRKYLQEEYV